MAIKNYTPHDLNFYREEDCFFDKATRKMILKEGASPFLTVPSSGVLNAKLSTKEAGVTHGIPVVDTFVESVDALPEVAEDDIIVVSFMYASAAKKAGIDTSKMYTPMTVYKKLEDGRVIPTGAYQLARV